MLGPAARVCLALVDIIGSLSRAATIVLGSFCSQRLVSLVNRWDHPKSTAVGAELPFSGL